MSSKKCIKPTRGSVTRRTTTLNMDFVGGVDAVKEAVVRKLMKYPPNCPFTRAQVIELLERESISLIQGDYR